MGFQPWSTWKGRERGCRAGGLRALTARATTGLHPITPGQPPRANGERRKAGAGEEKLRSPRPATTTFPYCNDDRVSQENGRLPRRNAPRPGNADTDRKTVSVSPPPAWPALPSAEAPRGDKSRREVRGDGRGGGEFPGAEEPREPGAARAQRREGLRGSRHSPVGVSVSREQICRVNMKTSARALGIAGAKRRRRRRRKSSRSGSAGLYFPALPGSCGLRGEGAPAGRAAQRLSLAQRRGAKLPGEAMAPPPP